MNDTKTMTTPEDVAAEIESAKAEMESVMDTANQTFADALKEQKNLFDKACASLREELRKNDEEIAKLKKAMEKNDRDIEEVKAIMSKNAEMLREKASFH